MFLDELVNRASYGQAGDLTPQEWDYYNALYFVDVWAYDKSSAEPWSPNFDQYLGAFESLDEAITVAQNEDISGPWDRLEFIIYHPSGAGRELYANEVQTIARTR